MSGLFGNFQNLFAPKANPIGVDYGSDSLRLAQVQWTGNEYRLIAAATADVPSHVRHNHSARFEFFTDTLRDLLAQSSFKGRQAVLSLPASSMYIQHLRLAKMDESEIKKVLPWEARGKLPIDPSHALLRHLIAGDVFQDQDPKCEVILMAASRDLVEQHLAAASKARLDVFGMNVEPKAIVDCFTQIYKRKTDVNVTSCYVDIGNGATRAVIAYNDQILFARSIPIGGEHLNRATADAMGIPLDDAKMLRIKLAHAQFETDKSTLAQTPTASVTPVVETLAVETHQAIRPETSENSDHSFAPREAGPCADRRQALAGEAVPPTKTKPDAESQSRSVEQACRETLNRLVEELNLCRRYHEATFPNRPINRLIFIGGEAKHRSLCQHIAREMSLAAQVGDPMARLGRTDEIGAESGIDRREPQPGWTVAIGLSMGPSRASATMPTMAKSA